GYMPGVYLHARRVNTSRYTTTEKLGQAAGSRQADIIRHGLTEQLEADSPALLVMSTNDYAMIREANPIDLANSTEEYPDWLGVWLQEFLRENYDQALEITEFNVLIFRRKDLAAESAFGDSRPPPLKRWATRRTVGPDPTRRMAARSGLLRENVLNPGSRARH
ncbi:MAG: hypothetical protein KKI02_03455, partial [Planctomycetes bacterium]|nr:hypothetical protein [Planctomycetota bacterium]